MAGKLKLQQELLISNLDVMLSMDSGNAHIAAMLGVKVITLWGATSVCWVLPFNQPMENALVSDRNQYPKYPLRYMGIKVAGYQRLCRTIAVKDISVICNLCEERINPVWHSGFKFRLNFRSH
jgi:hypothetical protein